MSGTETLVAAVEAANLAVVALATPASLAVRAEPELLRSLRLRLLPRVRAATEADLWFSPLVRSRGPDGVVFHPEVAELLRTRLADHWTDDARRPAVMLAWDIVAARHRYLSPALALEERLAWAVVSGCHEVIDDELNRVLAALATGQRPGLAGWAVRAWARLPAAARESRSGWVLGQLAPAARSGPAALRAVPHGVGLVDLRPILGTTGRAVVGVRRSRDELEIGAVTGAGAAGMSVPDTEPWLVRLEWADDDHERRVDVSVPRRGRVTVNVAASELRLITAAGDVYVLPVPPARPRLARRPGRSRGNLLIRVHDDNGQGWPIFLHVEDDSKTWLTRHVASALIPNPLPSPPVDVPEGASVQDAIRGFLLQEENASGRFQELGAYLHGLLHRGDVGARWKKITEEESGRRILLELPGSLASLPWELMRDRANWLAADFTSPLVRVARGFPGAGNLPPVRWPLRVLVVVGAQEHDRIVEAEEELANLDDAFRRMVGLVDVEFLRQPTREQVTATYAAVRPHIFHFIGHCSVQDGRGRLALSDPDKGQNVPWGTAEIQMDLRAWQPRLAILNACRSDRVDAQDGAWGVADAFAALGVPAVIAMQADIRGDAAAVFTGELYRALAAHDPLDVAVARSRQAISTRVDGDRRDYALPTLTLSAPPDSVLSVRFGVSERHRRHLERRHRRVTAFVDRTHERRRLWRDLDPVPEESAPNPYAADAIAIVGSPKVGKSELARWCVGMCELNGGNAAYVDLERGQRVEAVEALRAIADGLAGCAVHEERNREAFSEWSALTDQLLGAGAGDGPGHPPPAPDALENTFAYFQDALRQAAAGQPLLIALDDLGALPDEELELVCDLLLEPIALHRLAPVRVILVLSTEQGARLTDGLKTAMGNPIELTSFKPDQFTDIAGRFLRYHFDVPPKVVADKLEVLRFTDPFSWPQVTALEPIVKGYGWSRFT